MLKAMARLENGRFLIVLGITDGNVQRMKEGQPIYFDPVSIEIPPGSEIQAITLFYGKDEAELARTVRTLIGPTTKVNL
jgi:hypothetical protein